VSRTTTRLAQQRKVVEAAKTTLARLAAQAYERGDLQALSLLLDDDPQARLATDGLMTSVNDRQAQAVARVVAEQRTLATDQVDVAAQHTALVDAARPSAICHVLRTPEASCMSYTRND